MATECPRKVDGLDVTEVDDGLVVFHEPTDTALATARALARVRS